MTDVDDERLGALFREAAADPAAPLPGFDHQAVVTASRRITVRRRAAAAGVGLALFAVAGIGGALVLPGPSEGGGDPATAAAPMVAPDADARARPQVPPPAAESAPGFAPDPEAATALPPPLGPGAGQCADRQDPALRALVEQVLPEVAGAPEAAVTMECRPGGERGVNVEVRDGAVAGLLTVQYLPPGAQPEPVAGAVIAPTASGGTVVVASRAEDPAARAPFADRLPALVHHLAPRL